MSTDLLAKDVFKVIADPVRRDIIGHLARESLTVNAVTAAVVTQFPISRPAISKHLRILKESGIISIHQKGRERYCEIQPEKLKPVAAWLEPYRKMWDERLDSFEAYLGNLQSKNNENE